MTQNYEEQVNYQQAAKIIGVKEGTIRESVSDGKLTRCAYPPRAAYLLKAQVDLFARKGTTSKRALNSEQAEEWKKCEKIAKTFKTPDKENFPIDNIPPEIKRNVAYQVLGATKSYDNKELNIDQYADAILSASGMVLASITITGDGNRIVV